MAESALVASEADFRSLFEHMSEGFAYHEIVLREDGRPVDYVFLDVNEAFCELTGLEREAVLGRRVTEVIPGLEPRWIETYGRVALSGEPAEFEDWSEALGKCFSVAAYRPEPGKFACVFVDITDRKRSEARQRLITEVLAILNEPEDFQDAMRRVVAHLKTYTGFDAVGLRMWDNGDFPYSAQEGFPQDFLLKENTLTERGPDGGVCRDRDGNVKLECTCGLVLSGKVPSSHPLFTAGGSFWTNDSLPLLDLAPDEDPRHHPRNECIHRGYASVALIPLRSGAERIGLLQLNDKRPDRLTLELVNLLESLGNTIGIALAHKRAEEALAESERMYRALFGSAGDAVLVLHADRFFDCNEAAVRLFGCPTRRELLCKHLGDLSPAIQPDGQDSRTASDERIARAFREGSEQFEWLLKRVNGSTFPAEVRLTRVDLEAGPVVQGVIRDITSRKLAEEAQGRMVLVGQLATGVAHDLGNVLSGIKIWARLSKEGTANDDQVVESLISAADEGAAIVRGLMALARTGEHPAVEHLCIEKVIEPALTVVGRQLTTTGVEVLREYVSEGPFVAVDPAQMGRVFLNLAVNAGQAMPAGGTLTVETRYLSSASGVGEVVVTVTDTGRGIAPEHLPHVFEPFFTTKAASGASEVPGTGLGLSVARDIVAAHGGTITVRSEVGAGTTFEIRLPVNTETTAEE